jgi:hypothetical protein
LCDGLAQKVLEAEVNRYVVLYLATLIIVVPLDFLFLGLIAKGFFASGANGVSEHGIQK